MSPWLVVLTGCIYAVISLEQAFKGNTGVAVMFFGYAVGNVGIWLQVQ